LSSFVLPKFAVCRLSSFLKAVPPFFDELPSFVSLSWACSSFPRSFPLVPLPNPSNQFSERKLPSRSRRSIQSQITGRPPRCRFRFHNLSFQQPNTPRPTPPPKTPPPTHPPPPQPPTPPPFCVRVLSLVTPNPSRGLRKGFSSPPPPIASRKNTTPLLFFFC